MFIPVIIFDIKNPKLALIQSAVWLIFAYALIYFALLPNFIIKTQNDAVFQATVSNIDEAAKASFSFPEVLLFITVAGLIVILLVGGAYLINHKLNKE